MATVGQPGRPAPVGVSAPTPAALYEGASGIPWAELFSPDRTIAVDATVRDSGITHSHFAAQKTKDAIVDRFREAAGRRPDVDAKSPEVRIVVRIVRDECAVSLDTSGESLNRRGYRSNPSEASLKETLAAGLLLLAGWQGDEPLIDPACGAGTIPIEAALIAGNVAPGSFGRDFGSSASMGSTGSGGRRCSRRRGRRQAIRSRCGSREATSPRPRSPGR